jgi:hypothetical protein
MAGDKSTGRHVDQNTLRINRIRERLAASRARVASLLDELEAAWAEAGGRDGASLYTPHPHGPADPEGCGACRGTGRKGT